jgi:antitoxin component YwqK of YwqJK toxin-antitoxin module
MKKLLTAMFVALLMVGCGSPDLDDKETVDEIIAEAIDKSTLQFRGKEGEELNYAPNEQTPYTGWVKEMHDNGQINYLLQFKDGKPNGLVTGWYENGQTHEEINFKDGKMDGLGTGWYEDGQKKSETNFKDGKKDGLVTFWYEDGQKKLEANFKDGKKDGLGTGWYENGQKKLEANYKDGKPVTAVSWKPNGEKCPLTKIDKDGNGVRVFYKDDGTEQIRWTYKNGEIVRD